ncbi:MAG: DUF3810 domain-containing protein [Chitinophagaceae bacterium]
MFKRYGLVIVIALAVIIKVFSLFPSAVEKYYSHGIYPVLVSVLRFLFGWIPFSIGDVLYGLAVLYLLVSLVQFIRRLVKRKADRTYFLRIGKRTLAIILWVYVLFNGLWGLNYNRVGIAQQMNLKLTTYTVDDLSQIVQLTIGKLHQLDTIALAHRDAFHKKKFLFGQAVESYEQVVKQFPFLEYHRPSVKPSLYSYLGNYLGYTGYYNPFSGEAQVNTTVPLEIQPFTTTHEIGHQLGFAKENEANFAGFLAARASTDAAVQYSVYFDLYIYAYRNLAGMDSSLARSLHRQLPAVTRNDLRQLKAFYEKYENPFEPIIRKLYGQYLKANEQPQGILSYDEVIAWVVAYWRRYGEI